MSGHKYSQLLHCIFIINVILWPISFNFYNFNINLYYISFFIIFLIWLSFLKIKDFSFKFPIFLSFLIIFIYFSSSYLDLCWDKNTKFLLSFPIFIALSSLVFNVGKNAPPQSWVDLVVISYWLIIILFIEFMVEYFFPHIFPFQAQYRDKFKFSGFFSEPSHVAFSIIPCIAILFASTSRKIRMFGVGSIFLLIIFSRSSSLIVLIVGLILGLIFLQRKIKFFLIFLVGITITSLFIDINSIVASEIERLKGIFSEIDVNSNISSLVYLQGYQDAWLNFTRSFGLGVGLNMMGCSPLPDSSARNVLESLNLVGLNAEDGSFLASKIVSEFGFIGVLFLLYALFVFFKLIKNYNFSKTNLEREANFIKAILVFISIIVCFTRTAGYFGGPFFILVLILGSLQADSRCRINDYENA